MLSNKASLTFFKPDLLSIIGNILATLKLTRTWLSVKTDSLIPSIISKIWIVSFIWDGSLWAIGSRVFSTKTDRLSTAVIQTLFTTQTGLST